jgi:hypothetical protein
MTTASLGHRYRRSLLDGNGSRTGRVHGSWMQYVLFPVLLGALLLAVRPDVLTAAAALILAGLYLYLTYAQHTWRELSLLKRRRRQLDLVERFLARPDLDSAQLIQGLEMLATLYEGDGLTQAADGLSRDFADLLMALKQERSHPEGSA